MRTDEVSVETKAYNHIMYSDKLANELHDDAQMAEFYNESKTFLYWNRFYDRLEYLEDICIYAGIKMD